VLFWLEFLLYIANYLEFEGLGGGRGQSSTECAFYPTRYLLKPLNLDL